MNTESGDTLKLKKFSFDRIFSFIDTLSAGDRFVLRVVLLTFIVSLVWFFYSVNAASLTSEPVRGGSLSEGIVGTPRFVNPVLAVTQADRDVVSLVYAGLMRLGPDGKLEPDLAESVTISSDGLTYNIILKDNIHFHDGTPLTVDDVIFTISRVQDEGLKSPLLASWQGVFTEQISERELNIVLPEPYAPFIENLTLGILPAHIWEFATNEEFPFSQYNSEPIGAGPYEIVRINRNASGIPESYILTPSRPSHYTSPRIETLELHFYSSEEKLVEAFRRREVASVAGLSPESLAAISDIPAVQYVAPLPRTFALFFNQNEEPLFRDIAVRKALDMVVDRDAIIEQALMGHGLPIHTPIPPQFGISEAEQATSSNAESYDRARDTLRNAGWKVNEETGRWEKNIDDNLFELTFSIATVNTPVFTTTAALLKSQWEELGVVVDIKQFEPSDLTQTVIRPRKYDALLFGTVVGRELDFYSFWHSSQRNDPGLNVALYANITTDSILTEARTTNNFSDREAAYARFSKEVTAEVPAIFLYVPTFTYVQSPNVANVGLTGIANPSERFSNINQWYIESENVWPIFTDTNDN